MPTIGKKVRKWQYNSAQTFWGLISHYLPECKSLVPFDLDPWPCTGEHLHMLHHCVPLQNKTGHRPNAFLRENWSRCTAGKGWLKVVCFPLGICTLDSGTVFKKLRLTLLSARDCNLHLASIDHVEPVASLLLVSDRRITSEGGTSFPPGQSSPWSRETGRQPGMQR